MSYRDLDKFKKWHEQNRESISKRAHARYIQNIEEIREKSKIRYRAWRGELLNNPEKLRMHKELYKARERLRRKRLRQDLITAYGGQCQCCGESEIRFLTLEHTKKDGAIHRKLLGGNYPIYVDLKKRGWPKGDYTLLCWNCNCAERYGNECPHKLKTGEALCESR